MTEKYPDICHLVLTLLARSVDTHTPFPSSVSEPTQTVLDLLQTEKIDSFIMDAEVVAVDKDTGAYRTFQDLSNRAKKDVKVEDIKVIVGIFAFDLMLLNEKVSRRSTVFNQADMLSHYSNSPSRIDGTYFAPSFNHLQILATPFSPALLTSNRSTRLTAPTSPVRCRCFSKV